MSADTIGLVARALSIPLGVSFVVIAALTVHRVTFAEPAFRPRARIAVGGLIAQVPIGVTLLLLQTASTQWIGIICAVVVLTALAGLGLRAIVRARFRQHSTQDLTPHIH